MRHTPQRFLVLIGLTVALAVLGAACGKKAAPKTVTNQNANVSAAAQPVVYSIEMTDKAFVPAELKVGSSETIHVKLTNKDTSPHTMTFTGIDFDSGQVAPGASKDVTLTVPAKAGPYEFVSKVSGRNDPGLVGHVVVQ